MMEEDPCRERNLVPDGESHQPPSPPAVASLIDIETDVNAITTDPLTPTNKPPLTDSTEKLLVGSPALVPSPQSSSQQPTTVACELNNTATTTASSGPSLREPLETIDERETLQLGDGDAIRISPSKTTSDNDEENLKQKCDNLQSELQNIKNQRALLEQEVKDLKLLHKEELEREVQKRVELEQRFTEEAKRTTDQIEELIAKSDSDDTKLSELKNSFELYSRETSSMIESFTTNRELLASQLLELRKENDFLLGKYLNKARDLQSAEIDLPQTVEDLQFHCLTLNEKLILTTVVKENLEVMMASGASSATPPSNLTSTTTTNAPAPPPNTSST